VFRYLFLQHKRQKHQNFAAAAVAAAASVDTETVYSCGDWPERAG